jgi:hypothetical protein
VTRRLTTLAAAAVAAAAVPAARAGAQPASARAAAARLDRPCREPRGVARPDETLALAWSAVVAGLPTATAARVRVVDAGTGRELPSQPFDADADGRPDSLLFQADFRAREARAFAVEPLAPAAPYTPRTAARHDDPRDDMAWESDRIAWRVYGQGLKKTSSAMSSSGVDVWVKRTRDLIVDRWYKKGHDAYHVDTGEGADFYDVGETLGAGGTACGATAGCTAPTTSARGASSPPARCAPCSSSSTRRGTRAVCACARPSASRSTPAPTSTARRAPSASRAARRRSSRT